MEEGKNLERNLEELHEPIFEADLQPESLLAKPAPVRFDEREQETEPCQAGLRQAVGDYLG